jgi:hypothetical protein
MESRGRGQHGMGLAVSETHCIGMPWLVTERNGVAWLQGKGAERMGSVRILTDG